MNYLMKHLFIIFIYFFIALASYSKDNPKGEIFPTINHTYYRLFFAYRFDIRDNASLYHNFGFSFQKQFMGHGGRDYFWDKRTNVNLFFNLFNNKVNYIDLNIGSNLNRKLDFLLFENSNKGLILYPNLGGTFSYYKNENNSFNIRPQIGANFTFDIILSEYIQILDIGLQYGREIFSSNRPNVYSVSVALFFYQRSKTRGIINRKNKE